MKAKVLITGCNGLIGQALRKALKGHVLIGADNRSLVGNDDDSNFVSIVTDISYFKNCLELVKEHRPDWVFHLPAILSKGAEESPEMATNALRVNVNSLVHMLKLARKYGYRIFCPSSIAAFGPETPKLAPDVTIMAPKFLYGVTKVYNELLGDYFYHRYNVDFRSIRLPGVLAPNASIGSGTTDYAIEMLRATMIGSYECYLYPDTVLPMAHIDDCISGIIKIMSVPRGQLTRSVYNIQSFSMDPKTLHSEIENETGRTLKVTYHPDNRQVIADSWPKSLDDSNARNDWGWSPKFNLRDTIRSILGQMCNSFPPKY